MHVRSLFVLGGFLLASSFVHCTGNDAWVRAGNDTMQGKDGEGGRSPGFTGGRCMCADRFRGDAGRQFQRTANDSVCSDGGQWLGATRGRSYFVASVAPGARTICGIRQTAIQAERSKLWLAINVEAGKTYYVRRLRSRAVMMERGVV